MVSSCSELTLSAEKHKDYLGAWDFCLFQNWLEVRKTLNGGEKSTQGLSEVHLEWVLTGNSDGLGANQSRKVITDASWITEHRIFAAVHMSLNDDSSPAIVWKNHPLESQPGIMLNISADTTTWAALRIKVRNWCL